MSLETKQEMLSLLQECSDGNALMRKMADGTIYTLREKSNSDESPAVDINIKTIGLKSQKIHFVN